MSVQCDLVDKWSWPLLLRDQGPMGPESGDFIRAMLTLHTWMNTDTSATFVTLHTWAKGARMGVNTIQRQLKVALETGWLIKQKRRATKAHRSPLLRCAAPGHVVLTDMDVELADILKRKDIDGETVSDAPSDTANKAVAVSALGDTPNDVAVSVISDTANDKTSVLVAASDTGATPPTSPDTLDDAVSHEPVNAPMLYQITPLAVSLDPENPTCCINAVSAESSNPLAALETQPEVLESLRSREVMKSKNREGRAASDASVVSIVDQFDGDDVRPFEPRRHQDPAATAATLKQRADARRLLMVAAHTPAPAAQAELAEPLELSATQRDIAGGSQVPEVPPLQGTESVVLLEELHTAAADFMRLTPSAPDAEVAQRFRLPIADVEQLRYAG